MIMTSSIFDDSEEWQDMPVILTEPTLFDEEDKKRYHYQSNLNDHTISNATGQRINPTNSDWREKVQDNEMDYTRLQLQDDPSEDDIALKTQYLFNTATEMTPLAQLEATKTLLTEGQRIAYVGVCRLVAREMVQSLKIGTGGAKELEPAWVSAENWQKKVMGRLYRHMELDSSGQFSPPSSLLV